MIDVNAQRAKSALNATSSGQTVQKRSRFGSAFAFNSSAFECPVVIYDLLTCQIANNNNNLCHNCLDGGMYVQSPKLMGI